MCIVAPPAVLLESVRVSVASESHHLDACVSLRDAAVNQQAAAESQRKACQSKTTHLAKQVSVTAAQASTFIQSLLKTSSILFLFLFCRENCKVDG